MSDGNKFADVAPLAWGAVIVITLGLFAGTLLLNNKKKN